MHKLTRIAVSVDVYNFEYHMSNTWDLVWFDGNTDVYDVITQLERAFFPIDEAHRFSISIHAGGCPIEYQLRHADVGLTLDEVHTREVEAIQAFRALERELCNEIPF